LQTHESLVGRYYDPATGQFVSVDPLVDATEQAYMYTSDDPVNLTDPLGLKAALPNSVSFPGIGYVVTISSEVELTSGPCPLDYGITSNGTVNISAGNTEIDISSQGAVEGVFSDHGLSVSSSGDVSYTVTSEREVGQDSVSVDVTATLSPAPNSGSPGTSAAEDAAGLGGLLGLAGRVAKGVIDICTEDQPELCAP
jgi:hypothetical protein